MTESDEVLVGRAQRGERAAFEELLRRTSRLVFARLYLETGDTHQAEDLVQETYLLASGPQAGHEALADVAGAVPEPGEQAAQNELRGRVLAVLRSLPEEYRLPLT